MKKNISTRDPKTRAGENDERQRRRFFEMLAATRRQNQHVPAERLEAAIDQAVTEQRGRKRDQRNRHDSRGAGSQRARLGKPTPLSYAFPDFRMRPTAPKFQSCLFVFSVCDV